MAKALTPDQEALKRIAACKEGKEKELILNGFQIKELPLEIASLNHLESLYLRSTQVSDLSPLKDLQTLKTLYLRSTQVSDLSPLKDLQSINRLDLHSTQVSDLSPLKDLQKLTELHLSSTQVSDLSPLKDLQSINRLFLSSTQVSDLSPLKDLQSINRLDLRSTQVSDFSPLKDLQKLTELDLRSTQVSDLSPLKDLQKLTELDLRSTQVSDLSPLKDLQTLKTLYLRSTQVSDLSPLKDLQSINRLDLHSTQVSDLSPLKDLQKLTELHLSSTQVSDLSPLKDLQSINRLFLSSTQVSDLSPLKDLQSINRLFLSSTQVSDLSPLKDLQSINWLFLRSTQVSDLSPLKDLQSINWLDLRSTQVSDLSPLKELQSLNTLDLSHLRFHIFPKLLLDIEAEVIWREQPIQGHESSKINLFGNPLISPPPEIVQNGRKAVQAYFDALGDNPDPLNEVKLIFVGEGAVGKTSLIKGLFGEDFDQYELQTHGVKIRTWKPPECKHRPLKAHIWDFGGQDIMQATHQFFLSKRSVYVLVVDSRKEEKIEHWIKHIRSFGGNSPILLAINKIDENPAFDVNRKMMVRKYGLKEYHRVSAQSGQGLKEFKKALVKNLLGVPLINALWPKSWLKVKELLIKTQDDFIEYETYQKICQENGVKDEYVQKALIDFLHDLGIFLNFTDYELKGTQVLNPRWATGGVYKIINSPILAESKGTLNLNDLEEILKQKVQDAYFYPVRMHRFIIELMKKFELCYDLGGKTVMVPDLLPVDEPDYEFDERDALHYILQYDYMPLSIIPRFIVKLNRYIKRNRAWRTGVMLENGDSSAEALVIGDYEQKTITIKVNGWKQKRFLFVIHYFFKEIHSTFERLEVKELIGLPEDPIVPISHKHLLVLKENNIPVFIPPESAKKYKVEDLLSQYSPNSEEVLLEIMQKINEIDPQKNMNELISELGKVKSHKGQLSRDIDTLFAQDKSAGLDLHDWIKNRLNK